NEFVQLRIVRCSVRPHFCLRKSRRFGICVRIKYGHRHWAAARPKAETAHFLRISFARDRIRKMRNATWMWRGRTAREPCDREIKTSPEKMHRAAFPAETRAKILKHTIGLHKDTPESIRVFSVI